jgi:hypothetical protein
LSLENELSQAQNTNIKRALKIKTFSGALESMQFLTEVCLPDLDIPADKYYKLSNTQSQRFPISTHSIIRLPSELYRTQQYRRQEFLLFHAGIGTLFIGSASGDCEIFNQRTGASAWTRIETGYPSLAVSWITIDSANPNVMYIGTGENYGSSFQQTA